MPARDQGRGGQEGGGGATGLPLPRWALWLMLPGIIAPLFIFAFILLTESAHDPSRCPFREVERRTIAPEVVVIEQARNCVGEVEEHRYTVARDGETRLLGERRFEAERFAEGRYRWKATITEQGEVQVLVHNAGQTDLLLREGTAEEREKGISK